jgi:hypothetical protein
MASEYQFDPPFERVKCPSCGETPREPDWLVQCSRPECGEEGCGVCFVRCACCKKLFCESHIMQRYNMHGLRGDICIVCIRQAEEREQYLKSNSNQIRKEVAGK